MASAVASKPTFTECGAWPQPVVSAGVAGGPVEDRHGARGAWPARPAGRDRGDVDGVGRRVDRYRLRVAARYLEGAGVLAAGRGGGVAGLVVEYRDAAGLPGAGVGDIDRMGLLVDRDARRERADRDRRRCRRAPVAAVGVAGPAVDHRHRVGAGRDVEGADRRVGGERAGPRQRDGGRRLAAAAGDRGVATRGVDHRDVIGDLVGGVQRLGARVEGDRFGVLAGVNGGRPQLRAAGQPPAVAGIGADR